METAQPELDILYLLNISDIEELVNVCIRYLLVAIHCTFILSIIVAMHMHVATCEDFKNCMNVCPCPEELYNSKPM